MEAGAKVIVILEDASEREAVTASLREGETRGVPVLAARTPALALREPEFRDARLVMYDCAALGTDSRMLAELFPGASILAIASPGSRNLAERELRTGAAEYVIRDPAGDYLRQLARKAASLLERVPAPPGPTPAAMSFTPQSIVRLEESLRQSEIRFGQLVQAIPDIVYHLDPDGYFVFVNEAVSVLGYTPQELVGRHFSVIVHPDELPNCSRAHVLRRLRVGDESLAPVIKLFDERRSGERRTRGLVLRLLGKPGASPAGTQRIGDVVSYGVIEALGHYDSPEGPPRDDEGREDRRGSAFLGTVGIIHDVTLNKRSEETIRFLLQAVDQSPVSIVIIDALGRVEYANPLFLHESGMQPEHLLGRNVANLTESPRVRSAFTILAETAERGGEWRGKLPDAGAAAGPRWDQLYVSPVRDPQGQISHFIAVLAVTARAAPQA